MDSELHRLHIFFLPFMAHGHMIPTIEMAKLFATRGIKATIVTTPLNLTIYSKHMERIKQSGLDINIQIVKFPSMEAGLPEGCENIDAIISSSGSNSRELVGKFSKALSMLREPLLRLLQEHRPDCLIADMFFPWATDVATECEIPRIVVEVISLLSMCASEAISRYEPHKKVSSDSEAFIVPDLPGEIKLTRHQLADNLKQEGDFTKLLREVRASQLKCFGNVVNSCYQLEKDYADYFRNVMGMKAWLVGPLSLYNKDVKDKTHRGKEASIDEDECFKWLDSKEPNSVIYVCFGSEAHFDSQQLMEIALGLEASEQNFIWVARKGKKEEQNGDNDWLPQGFEERMEGKGLIIRGWAPQVPILDHVSVGGFVTHCGWNSILEGICAGVPMVTRPVTHEQFLTEKLVTQVLQVGIGAGVKRWVDIGVAGDIVSRDDICKAVRQIMVGEEAEEMRRRTKVLQEMARAAVEEGGSSYTDLTSLIEELRLHRAAAREQ
ncbi:scopoletin glucosyltransferase-like [Syzygium oleosum]|uniref:scopoletin glucosyltransferase-like n=1 Tax=Syzygium oleosum TaxID=219896 RepID=UPI0011D1A263|nr:scopoletin glucosyltransferase-like [Syzygium oleosum]